MTTRPASTRITAPSRRRFIAGVAASALAAPAVHAQAQVTITRLHSVLSLPRIGQVYMTFIGRLQTKQFSAGFESLDVRLFPRDAIPWEEIAFPVVKEALRHYIEDAARGTFQLHVADVRGAIN